MYTKLILKSVLCFILLTPCFGDLVESRIDGKLGYNSYSTKGDQIPDYSRVGYLNGIDVSNLTSQWSVVVTLTPSGGDDTAALNNAIATVASYSINGNGFRGSVKLSNGQFNIYDTITISDSGIVIEGSGSTVVKFHSSSQIDGFYINGGNKNSLYTYRTITSEYVPAGSRLLEVNNAANYVVGDKIVVLIKRNQSWVDRLGVTHADWKPGTFEYRYERRVVDKSGNYIYLDIPIPEPIEAQYGFGLVARMADSRISHVAILNLELQTNAVLDTKADPVYSGEYYYYREDHPWKAIHFNNARDCFVYNTVGRYWGYSLVHMGNYASHITVDSCMNYDPVSECNQGTRRYTYCIDGQLCLVRNSYSHSGRHDFVQQDRTPGPNVFVDSVAEHGYDFNEAHQKWGVGALYDNIDISGRASLQATNRSHIGAGEHGWAAANQVFWNCSAPIIWAQSVPDYPGVDNFILGVKNWYSSNPNYSGIYNYLWNNFPVFQVDYQSGQAAMGGGIIENPTSAKGVDSLYHQQYINRLADAGYDAIPAIYVIEAESCSSNNSYCDIIGSWSSASSGGAIRFNSTANWGTADYGLSSIADGYYDIRVIYYDESDGEASLELRKNGGAIGALTSNEFLATSPDNTSTNTTANKTMWVVEDVKLTPSDTLTLAGLKESYDWGWVDYIELVEADAEVLNYGFYYDEALDLWSATSAVTATLTVDGVRLEANNYDAKLFKVVGDELAAGDYTLEYKCIVDAGLGTIRLREGSFGSLIISSSTSMGGVLSQDFTVSTSQSSFTIELRAANPTSDVTYEYVKIRKK